jgi:hypothetical protein
VHPGFNNGRNTADWLKAEIAKVIEQGADDEVESDTPAVAIKPPAYVPTIQDRVREAAGTMNEEIDYAIDEWITDPEKFDPILDAASPFMMFSLQNYTKERIMDSEVIFDQFNYKSRFVKDKGDEDATFEEVITFSDPKKHGGRKYREHKHRLHMPSLDDMLDLVKSSGFTRHELIDMTPAGFEYQYILFLTK